MTVCISMYLHSSLIISQCLCSYTSIYNCLSLCLSVSWSVCLRLVVPSLSVYCYLYVFISVSLSLCLPVLPALQFRMFAYFSVPVFVCFPASGSVRVPTQQAAGLPALSRSTGAV